MPPRAVGDGILVESGPQTEMEAVTKMKGRDASECRTRRLVMPALGESPADGAASDHGYVVGLPIVAGTDESQAGARLSLWWAPLDIPASALRGLAGCLSSEERQAAGRFR